MSSTQAAEYEVDSKGALGPDDVVCKPRYGPGMQWGRVNLTVIGVLLVFIYLFYVDVFLIIIPWLSYSVPGVTNLFILTANTLTSVYCYLFCVVLDPGSVPTGWHPDDEQAHSVTEVKRKGGALRYCQKCQWYKPPRTHHCRVCNRCVLRMDHHCPWTNNCIGHANYRAFLLFLVYVNAALVHTVGLICAHVLHALQASQEQRIVRTGPQANPVHLQEGWLSSMWVWAVMQTVAFVLALPLCIGLLMLLAWHLHLITYNKTTIEYQEGVRAAVQGGAGAALYEHPYDLGFCTNLHEVMGENAASWIVPPCHTTPGGTRYQTIWDERLLGLG